MRAPLCAIAGIIVCWSGTASAEPAPVSATQIPTWTGAYFGAHGGYSHTKAIGESDVIRPLEEPMKGPAFGVQAGYNHQWGLFVLGVEADVSYVALQREFRELSDYRLVPSGSVRPRLGLDLNGVIMPYATGGISYLRFAAEGTSATSAAFGYVWGGGVSLKLGTHWSAFAEYLHSEPVFYDHTFRDIEIAKYSFRNDLVRAGLNFHPGRPAVVAQSDMRAPFDWSGFYVGVNGGYISGEQLDDLVHIRGPAVGAQAGYTHQFGKAVIGLETDFAYLAARGEYDIVKARMDKLGQLRARLGYDINGLQPYISGGIAYGTGKIRGNTDFESASFGYVFGGGAATRLNRQWSGYLEAMHVLLEDNPGNISTSATLIRVGLNYHAP